ncbi:MAG: SPOR domain-containing protein, partial [Kiloniellaceae bacterium]
DLVEIVEDESRRLTLAALSAVAAADAPDAVPLVPVSAQALPAPDVYEADAYEAGLPAGDATPGKFQTASAVPRDGTVARNGVLALDGAVSRGPVEPSEIYIQAGAFTRVDLAIRLRARLAKLGDVRVAAAEVDDRQYFRVRIGPLATVDEADRLLNLLLVNGHTEARVVVE